MNTIIVNDEETTKGSFMGFLIKCYFIIVLLLLSLPCNMYAKLANFQYDLYIRKSDIIVEGTVTSRIQYNDMVFFKLQATKYYYGTDSSHLFLMSHTGKQWVEDQPEWHIGEKVVLFLIKKVTDDFKYFDCLWGYSSKIVLHGDHVESDFFHYKNKNDFINMIKTFTAIRTETDTNTNIVTLINLLNSKDIGIIDGACDYLNYLVNHEDHEKTNEDAWNQFRDLSYQERLKKFIYWDRGKWRKWWIERTFHKQ